MEKFNIGDYVKKKDDAKIYKIVGVDDITQDVPYYKLTDGSVNIWEHNYNLEKIVFEQDVLRYGKIIIDNSFETNNLKYVRIRIVSFEGKIYFHQMCNGKIEEFKEIGRVL